MRLARPVGLLVLPCLAALVVACGSDSPTGPQPRTLAVHFDSLWQAAVVSFDTVRVSGLFRITVPLAYGVAPHDVKITVDGTPVTFHAISYEYVYTDSSGTPYDTGYHFTAWTGANAAQIVTTDRYVVTNRNYATYLDGGTEEVGVQGTLTSAVLSATGTCSG